MIICIFDFKVAFALFVVICTTASALQSDVSLARAAAEGGQTHKPIGDENIRDGAADLAKVWHPKLSAFLDLIRSRQHRVAKHRATQGPGDGKAFAAATPGEDERTALEIHIFCITTLGLVLIFTLASCCAASGGPSSTNLRHSHTGSAVGQSCFAFSGSRQKSQTSREIPFDASEHLLVCARALRVGNSSPFNITEPDGREAFHVRIVDGSAPYISNILHRSGSNLSLERGWERSLSLQSIRADPTAQTLEIFKNDGTPLIAVTSRRQIFSMTDRKAVARLEEKSDGVEELISPQGWSSHVCIERLPTGALVVTPHGLRFTLATVTLEHSFMWQNRIHIAFGRDVAAQPRMRITLLAALLGSIAFQGNWKR